MLIQDWMAKDVMTVDENTSLMRATRIMKENSIRRLPVVSHGKLIGIITDRDVKDASPSKTTSLDIHELYYLLSEMKVKDVMTADPLTLVGSETLEKAAVVMLQSKISGLPVVDPSGHLIGLLSETDVLRGFIHSTGIKNGALQYVFDLPDEAGSVTRVTQVLKENSARIISILTSFDDAPPDMKRVAVRIASLDTDEEEILTSSLKKQFTVVYYGRDELTSLPQKKK
ncbi:MAG: CBS and ACT domain-containing protein [Proteobacteria bacterium]|nr:CBS and ACT domain-containing protein [Pseudomonadota bacterium]MBU1688219.1 CBS and ACT domain-containing protein [Pseudomonadota bacterium]